jgi:ceramide glucosyltransferase
VISAIFLVIAAVGCLYLLYAIAAAAFAKNGSARPTAPSPAVTILKPLHGAEPRLFENLKSLCDQDYSAPIEIICGVQDQQDAAIAVVERLKVSFPDHDLRLIIDPSALGANLKVSNLINMARHARHECLILADSDIGVGPRYLAEVTAALTGSGVGGVTCLYHGVAAAGFWSRLSALAIDAHFLPNVLVGLRTGLAKPCFGSTIALTRQHLAEIGGFEAFVNCLADDYAIGEALRARGLRVDASNMLVAHSCSESSFLELWRHELRWARTIRSVDPAGYAGSLVTHPLAWALLALATGAPALGAIVAAFAIVCRMVLLSAVTRNFGLDRPRYWLIPARDLLSFAVFVWSFCGTGLTWRGRSYHIRADGALTVDQGTKS